MNRQRSAENDDMIELSVRETPLKPAVTVPQLTTDSEDSEDSDDA